MAQKNYRENEAIQVVYQAPNSETGIVDVTMVIYDETGALDGVNFPDVTMTEVGTTGKYRGTFTPDAQGEWETHISHNSQTEGKVVKQYSVGSYNIHEIGSLATSIDSAVASIDSPPMIG